MFYGAGPSSHQACKKEIDELNRQLFEKTRIVEEYQVKENSLAQVCFHHFCILDFLISEF